MFIMNHEAAIAFHPGTYIKDELDARGWTQKNLSIILAKSTNEVNEVITGKRNITPRWALLLAAAFGTSEDMWLGLQKDYDIFREKNKFPKRFLDQIKVRAEEFLVVS
jgi:HTH-type transcriptional regulator/antitoxin HigA